MSRRHNRGPMTGPLAALGALAVAALAPLAVAQHQSMPPRMSHEEHMKQLTREQEMNKRGNLAMEFDQEKATHHFYLTRTGGRIEVSVIQNADEETRKQ